MLYLIDGHNLIPYVKGLNLSDLDDELRLIEYLQIFARVKRTKIEVFFDRAAAGHSGSRRFGSLTAHFIPSFTIADVAIINRVRAIGKAAGNCTVVTSDQRVMAECRNMKARLMDSPTFAKMLGENQTLVRKGMNEQVEISEDEVADWLELFRGKTEGSDKA